MRRSVRQQPFGCRSCAQHRHSRRPRSVGGWGRRWEDGGGRRRPQRGPRPRNSSRRRPLDTLLRTQPDLGLAGKQRTRGANRGRNCDHAGASDQRRSQRTEALYGQSRPPAHHTNRPHRDSWGGANVATCIPCESNGYIPISGDATTFKRRHNNENMLGESRTGCASTPDTSAAPVSTSRRSASPQPSNSCCDRLVQSLGRNAPSGDRNGHSISVTKSVAEGAGFEPAIRFPAYTLSRRAPSAARPPLRDARLDYEAARRRAYHCAMAQGKRKGL